MRPSITVVVEGEDSAVVEGAAADLEQVPDISVTKIGEERGVLEGVGKLIKWAVEFAGDVNKVADALIGVAEKYFSGSSIKVRYGDREFEVTNVRRDDLVEVLKTVQSMAQEADAL